MEGVDNIMENHSKKDYYSEDGTLLLAKGVSITSDTLRRLQQFNVVDEKKAAANHASGKKIYIEQARKIKDRFKGTDKDFNQASDILTNILFESKQKPWWIFINALGNYIDWIYTHSIDVAMISLMMAVELQYTEKDLCELGLGATLHDVGKLLIPKRILQKVAPITEVEKMILRQHCELGVESVSNCSLPEASAKIILQHHERLNGNGYPNKLKAEQISEFAKIVMIADAFDAITAGRPYKKAKGTEETLLILKAQKGEYEKKYLLALEAILT